MGTSKVAKRKWWLLAGASVLVAGNATPSLAQDRTRIAAAENRLARTKPATQNFNIPPQSLQAALNQFARQSDSELLFSTYVVRSKRSSGVRGRHVNSVALASLLRGTGLTFRRAPDGAYLIEASQITPSPQPNPPADSNGDARSGLPADAPSGGATSEGESTAAASADNATPVEEIVVTGTRIRGGQTASPTVALTREQVRQEGRTNLGEVIRDVPQNYRGGQNPGVIIGASGLANQNITGGSSLNLRGLGPDATLTLLNGKRLSYSGFVNAVDVSVVPIEALDRLEIVPDGASAIYGSDAVAGVANIIIRRDYDGLAATLRGGTTTDGGRSEYQLSLTGGTTWGNGGFIVAFDRLDADAIDAKDRDYLVGLREPFTLFPAIDSHSALFSAHQGFGTRVELNVDAIYTTRDTASRYLFPEAGNNIDTRTETFAIAPSLEVEIARDWTLSLSGTYGTDKVRNEQSILDADGTLVQTSKVCYCNSTEAIEFGVQGVAFSLPAGEVRLAVGGGYRRNDYELRGSGDFDTSGSRRSRFAYGELNIPLVSPAMGIAGVRRLTLTGALRYEDYNAIGDVTTPKLGFIYQPVEAVLLKGSWGRSFKAPTLSQQFFTGNGFLATAADFGGAGFPDDATVLFIGGGNTELEPERATTWSATASFQPPSIPSLRFEVTYFRVNYRDRVGEPIADLSAALINPAVAEFVNLSPTPVQLQEAVAFAGPNLFNLVDGDPLQAVAIVNGRFVNLATDRVRGVDVSSSYGFGFVGGNATVRGSASWLKGNRQLLPGEPSIQTVGLVFNPPKFQARAGIVWEKGGFDTSFFFNHVGSVVEEDFGAGRNRTGAFNTFDLTFRFRTDAGNAALSGLEFVFSANNLFNEEPPLLTSGVPGQPSLDTTNYSPVGRALNLSVTKRW